MGASEARRQRGARRRPAAEGGLRLGAGGHRLTSGSSFSAIPEITDAERAVADLLPIGGTPDEPRARSRGAALVPHVRPHAETASTRRASRATTATGSRSCPRASKACACSTWARSTASTRSWPSTAAPSGWSRSTTSSTSTGSGRAGGSARGRRGLPRDRASCSPRASSTARRRVRARGLGERFDFVLCFGILHRVENPLGLLRILGGRLAPGGRCWWRPTGSLTTTARPRGIEVQQPGDVYARDDFVYWGFPPARWAPSPRSRASRPTIPTSR